MGDIGRELARIQREDSRRILATLVRLLGDWDLAEEALQDAFVEALSKWPSEGIPSNPRAWLVSAGRFRAVDKIRRGARFGPLPEGFEELLQAPGEEDSREADLELPDDRLRMVFTCCHPALSEEARVALMLFQESRREARLDPNGELVLLEDQDRSRWDTGAVARGQKLVDEAFAEGRIGPYALQAAIASLHATSASAETTDWLQIAGLYQVLRRCAPSPVVDLNAAVATGMAYGIPQGLERIEALLEEGSLESYALAHSARAAFLERLGRHQEAGDAWRKALEKVGTDGPQRRFLERKIRENSP